MDTKAMDMEKEQKIRRFASGRIAEHWVLIVTFTVLAVTGLSQKFYYLDVSRWLIFQLGGIDAVRMIHRYTGIAFALLALEHIATSVVGVSVFKWQPTMMVTKKDFRDAAHNVKYYIGMAKAPAACGRYDYKEKFNYWLVLTGGVVMILTGFTLWFPIGVVRYLPGEAIPLAKALHSNEALLIFLLVIVWHIYDSIFSPDVFPMDTSIFTGYTTRRKMLRLHPLELANLEGASPEETLVERARATGQMGFDT